MEHEQLSPRYNGRRHLFITIGLGLPAMLTAAAAACDQYAVNTGSPWPFTTAIGYVVHVPLLFFGLGLHWLFTFPAVISTMMLFARRGATVRMKVAAAGLACLIAWSAYYLLDNRMFKFF